MEVSITLPALAYSRYLLSQPDSARR